MKLILSVPEIHCSSCVNTIEGALRAKFFDDSSFWVKGHADTKMVTVTASSLNTDDIIDALGVVGFDAQVFSFSNAEEVIEKVVQEKNNEAHKLRQQKAKLVKEISQKEQKKHLLASLVLVPLGFALLALSFVTTPLSWPWLLVISIGSTVACLGSSFEMYKTAWLRLKMKKTSMDLLFSLSTLSALAVSTLALFNPAIGLEFHTALLILGAHRFGQYLKSKMQEKFETSELFSDRLPKEVKRLKTDPLKVGVLKSEHVLREDIEVGEELLVYPNEVIPLDGIVLNNSADILTTMQDGDLIGKPATAGMGVLAGMSVQRGELRVKVTKRFNDCYALQVEDALEELSEKKSKLESVADKIMDYFIPAILVMTGVCGLMTVVFAGPLMGLHTALGMLVAACPCTLGLIVPFAVRSGASRIAREGVITNDVQAMEKAAKVKTIAFDLNGTLTKGVPMVKHLSLADEGARQRVLNLLYTLEKHALSETKHPVAKAVVEYAEREGGNVITNATLFDLTSNKGLIASIEGERYFLGNNEFSKEHGLRDFKEKANQLYLFDEQKRLLATLKTQDILKKEAAPAIGALQKEGYRVIVITGADLLSARALTSTLGISDEDVYANVIGAKAKGERLERLEDKYGSIAMVGDGANDVLALKQAALGISFDNGDKATKSKADFIIKTDSLFSVANLLHLSKNSLSIVKQCLMASLAYNVAAILLTCCLALSIGAMSPVAMASLMAVQSLMVLGYATRIKTLPVVVRESIEAKDQNEPSPKSSRIAPKKKCCCKPKLQPQLEEQETQRPTLSPV